MWVSWRNGRRCRAALVALLAVTALPATEVWADGARRRAHAKVRLARGDWPTYGHDLRNSWMNPRERKIRPATVARLSEAWRFPADGSVTAPTSTVGGFVYAGDWAGVVYKLRARDGTLVWRFQTQRSPVVDESFNSSGGHITGGITIADAYPGPGEGRQRWVFVASGRTVYCLRDSDGSVVWTRIVPGNPEAPGAEQDTNDPNLLQSTPRLFDGHLFLGSSTNGAVGYRGRLVKLDAVTGALQAAFEIDAATDDQGQPLNRGCGGMWTTVAIDERLRLLYFGTADCVPSPGNPGSPVPQPPWHECLMALRTDDLSVAWSFCPFLHTGDDCDVEFGSAPILFRGARGRRLVGQGAKAGVFYVRDARTGEEVWSQKVVDGGSAGGFVAPAATDGRRIYAATGIGDLSQDCPIPGSFADWVPQTPHIHVFDARTGAILWQATRAPTFAAASLVRGVLIQPSSLGSALEIFDARRGGDPLLATPLASFASSGASIAGGMLFLGSGQGFGTGDAVYGFALQ